MGLALLNIRSYIKQNLHSLQFKSNDRHALYHFLAIAIQVASVILTVLTAGAALQNGGQANTNTQQGTLKLFIIFSTLMQISSNISRLMILSIINNYSRVQIVYNVN
jgi:hypothetical protein